MRMVLLILVRLGSSGPILRLVTRPPIAVRPGTSSQPVVSTIYRRVLCQPELAFTMSAGFF